MNYLLNVPGFEGGRLQLQAGGLWSGPKLLLDGEPAPKGPKRGTYVLRRNDGSQAAAQLKLPFFLDTIPQVIVDETTYTVVEPLKWYEWLWSALPILLVFAGGLLGGIFGGLAVVLNARLFRSNLNRLAKFGLTALISIAAAAGFFLSAGGAMSFINSLLPSPARELRSQAGGFTVMTPYAMTEQVETVQTEIGPIEFHLFTAEVDNRSLAIGYSDYPQAAIGAADPKSVLDGSRDGSVANIGGKLVSESEIRVSGFPGRELLISATLQNGQAVMLRGRIVLAGNRLYQVICIVPQGEENSRLVSDYLASFSLLEK